MPEHGTVAWNELNTWEPAKARAFYEAALGWTFSEMPMPGGTYLIAHAASGRPVAGVIDMAWVGLDRSIPAHWLTYIEVDDIDLRIDAARAAGARIIREPFDVPEVGRIAILMDPTGAAQGWMTSIPR